jgi:hypothetical protein
LNEKDLFQWCVAALEGVPQIFPRFMCVPVFSRVKTFQSLREENFLCGCQISRLVKGHVGAKVSSLKQYVFQWFSPHSSRGGLGDVVYNGGVPQWIFNTATSLNNDVEALMFFE